MAAFHSTTSSFPRRLRAVDDGTGNDLAEPESFVIESGGYSESFGFGGHQLTIELRNVDESASGSDDDILIETFSDGDFDTTPVVTEEYGTIAFPSIPVGGTVMVRNLEAGNQYCRINNTSDVDIEVNYWVRPNR